MEGDGRIEDQRGLGSQPSIFLHSQVDPKLFRSMGLPKTFKDGIRRRAEQVYGLSFKETMRNLMLHNFTARAITT